ncbi:MAG TPA: glycosyltransferase family 1 protein [Trichocoleus sp.]
MLVNLAYLLKKPTGTTTYALNLLPYLNQLNPCYLSTSASGLEDYYSVPENLTAEYGVSGHLRRLLWTQFGIPSIYQKHIKESHSSNLLFSPIPEAPIGTNCRIVVTVHDLIPRRFPKLSRALAWLYQYYVPRVLSTAEHIICDSYSTANDLIQFYGLSAKKITPILLAHDSSHFQPLNLEQQNYFLVLGRHAPYKNIASAISAFSKLPNFYNYELWIAGPSDSRYTPALEAQIQALNLSNQVKFLDYVPYQQLPILLNQAIALVFPSLWEGFGLPALEAMACGTPVITSNLSSLPEVVGSAAILIDPHNINEMADAMRMIIDDPQMSRNLRITGLEQARRFSWEKTGQQTVEVLQRFL